MPVSLTSKKESGKFQLIYNSISRWAKIASYSTKIKLKLDANSIRNLSPYPYPAYLLILLVKSPDPVFLMFPIGNNYVNSPSLYYIRSEHPQYAMYPLCNLLALSHASHNRSRLVGYNTSIISYIDFLSH